MRDAHAAELEVVRAGAAAANAEQTRSDQNYCAVVAWCAEEVFEMNLQYNQVGNTKVPVGVCVLGVFSYNNFNERNHSLC